MRVVVSEFISLDGIVQAPGGPDGDTSGGYGSLSLVRTLLAAELVDELGRR